MENLIIIYALNSREIYLTYEWLENCVCKRMKSGQACTVEHLAECATLKKIVRESSKIVKEFDGNTPTNEDKRSARYELAARIIDEAKYIVS